MRHDWPGRVRRLEDEVAGLRRAMRARGLIEQAKGILAERFGCDPEAAFEVLSAQSQRTNTPLTAVAADVVGRLPAAEPPPAASAADKPEPIQLADPLSAPQLRAVVTETERPEWLSRDEARGLSLAKAALEAAADLDELVQSLVATGLRQEPEAIAAIYLSEPDGALRLLASAGWSPQITSAWRRIPPSLNTALARAVRTGRPVVTGKAPEEDQVWIGPGTARMVFPLVAGRRVVGALFFAWPDERDLSEATQRHVCLLAVEAGRAASRLWPTFAVGSSGSSVDLDWVKSILDGVTGDAHLLVPLRASAGRVTDFLVEAASRRATAGDPAMIGRRLLDVAPQLAANGVFEAYVEVLANGGTWEGVVDGVRRRAIPVGGAVLASWEPADANGSQRLARLEAMGGFGWAEWEMESGETSWSPGMARLFGRAHKAPMPFDGLAKLVEPAHLPRLEAFRAELLAGRDAVVELRLTATGAARWVRLFGEATEVSGRGKRLQLLAQDVSERHAREERLRAVQSQAAAGRLRLATEQDLSSRLAHLFYPSPVTRVGGAAARVTGRHWRGTEALLQTDFCEAVQLPGGRIVAMIGDVFSVGTAAAGTAVRLIRPVLALARAGLSLRRILEVMNAELRADQTPALASLLLTAIDPATGDFTWASAGHLPPVLVQPNGSRQLTGAAMPLLGLTETGYAQKRVRLGHGSAVVCYTDGMVDQNAEHPLAQLEAELSAAYQTGGADAVLSAQPPKSGEEACLMVAEFA